MARKIIKGDKLQIFLNGYCPLYATSHTISLSADQISTASKDHGFWNASSVGKLSWEITAECLYTDNDYDLLFDAFVNQTKILAQFAKVRNYDKNGLISTGGNVNYWVPETKGQEGIVCITSLNANANTGENSTFSITLTGNGPLSSYNNTITPYIVQVKYNTELYDSDENIGIELFNNSAKMDIASVFVGSMDNSHLDELEMTDNRYPLDSTPNNAYIQFYIVGPYVPEYMFKDMQSIDEVYIMQDISVIKEYAFAGSSITNINYQNDYINIMHHAFYDCNFLGGVNKQGSTGPNFLNAKKIGNNAFSNCVRLNTIYIGNGCKEIGSYAFDNCLLLSSVYTGDDLTNIGDYTFAAGNEQRSITIYFTRERAPIIGRNSLGNPYMLTVALGNSRNAVTFTDNFQIGGWYQYTTNNGVEYTYY